MVRSVFALTLLFSSTFLAAAKTPWRVKFDVKQLAIEKHGADHTGSFVMEVHPEWAPLGAARFEELVKSGFYKDLRFLRHVKDFAAQFGATPDIALEAKWTAIKDDPKTQKHELGMVGFTGSGKESRKTQIFINTGGHEFLDETATYTPFAKIVEGMDFVQRIFEVGEMPLNEKNERKTKTDPPLKITLKPFYAGTVSLYHQRFPELTVITGVSMIKSGDEL